MCQKCWNKFRQLFIRLGERKKLKFKITFFFLFSSMDAVTNDIFNIIKSHTLLFHMDFVAYGKHENADENFSFFLHYLKTFHKWISHWILLVFSSFPIFFFVLEIFYWTLQEWIVLFIISSIERNCLLFSYNEYIIRAKNRKLSTWMPDYYNHSFAVCFLFWRLLVVLVFKSWTVM